MFQLWDYKAFSRKGIKDIIMVFLGSLVMASGYVFFIVPYKIIPGGVYGIAIILHHTFGLPTGTSGLVMNIPLLIWGVKELGPRFGWRTIMGMTATSLLIDLITVFWGNGALIENDLLLSSLYGGVLIGAGLALIFMAKGTTGGSDIVAQILYKRSKMPMGQLLILIDTAVVILGVIMFKDIKLALYAIITIYVTGQVIDTMTTGMNHRKGAFIVSEKYNEIADYILKKLRRGATFFHSAGIYKNDEKEVIFTALTRRELFALQENIKKIDPNAFMTVIDIRDVRGEGFKSFSDDSI
ncbi:MAG: YitT family protein [Candidatus Delongbacteria bacterium]|nr:YitT family protein [Candidatus Delongbacteria bacterium]